MLDSVTAPKTSKPRTAKAKTPKPAETESRRKSLLTRIGEDSMKKALLKALRENDWNLTATAEALEMSAASSVIRSIHALGLTEEYEAARKRGDVKPGPRIDTE